MSDGATAAIKLRRAARTDVGKAREHNEDDLYAGRRIYAVADGLGGHRAGEVASRIAVEVMRDLDGGSPGNLRTALEESFRTANKRVFDHAAADPETRGMATTLTALAVEDSVAHLAHVGDSRCYLLREGEMTLLTRDHTLVARMVADGTLSPEEAETHPQRSVVTRALGAEPLVDVDTLELTLQPADRFLICSDGLSSVVPFDEIMRALSEATDLEALTKSLIAEANNRGGPDNITVLVLEVPSDAALPATPAHPVTKKQAVAKPRRRFPVRLSVWLVVVLGLILGGLIGARAWINSNYYVGISGSNVAIYKGLPADFLGLELHSLVEKTDVLVADVPEFFRDRLEEGITASSIAEARRKASEVPRATPTPTPSPTGSPS